MPRRSLLPCLLTLPEFIVVDQQIHAAGGGIDPDTVAFADQRQWAANERFRRDVADAHPACRAGKAPIGNECALLSHALAVNQRRDAQHLPHAGTADRAFIANDENITGGILATADSLDTLFLVFEYAGRALEHQAFETGDLDDSSSRAEIALQNCDASIRHDRGTRAEDD